MMNEWILSSTLLITAVVLVRFVLREKISLRLRYALWLVVLVRLLVPVQLFTSDFGVGRVARDVDLSTPVRRVYMAARSEDYKAEYEAAYQQLQAEYATMDQPVSPDSLDKEASSRVTENRSLDVTRTLYRLWLSGMAVLALVLVGCNGRFALRLRRSRTLMEENVLLPVYESSLVPTPCMFGVFQPGIYLTPGVAADDKARTHVLAHELTHYRHWDHIWSVLRCLCLVLHWYNPLVWLAFRLSREDAELACDEGALELLGEETRTEYGRTLIQLTCGEKLSTGLIAATTMTGSARSIARRLKTLMKGHRTTLLALIAVILAGTVAIGCTFSGAPETTEPDSRSLTTEDGIIVYPGTAWGMTPEEVKTTLGLKDAECTVYTDEIRSDGQAVYAFEAENQVFFGVGASVSFVFRSYTPEQKPVLEIVHVELETEADFDAVYLELVAQLGEPEGGAIQVLHKETDADGGNFAGSIQTWKSERKVSDYATAEQWQLYLEKYGSVSEDAAASTLTAYGARDEHLPQISFHSNMLELLGAIDSGALDLTALERILQSCMALFEKDGAADWYRAAISCLYDDPTQIHLGELFCEQLADQADLTAAELETLRVQYPQDAIDSASIIRVTVPEMRAVMEEYFGVSLDDCDLGTMENYLYCAETEAYLELAATPNAYDPEFSGGAALGNGDVVLYYTNRYYAKHYSDKVCAITLRQKGDVWQIVSNRLVDPPEEDHTPTPDMSYQGHELPIPEDPGATAEKQIRMLFSAEGDPAYRGALTRLYAMPEDFDYLESELFQPQILDIRQISEQEWQMRYQRPGSDILYAVNLLDYDTWQVYSNRMVLTLEDYRTLNPRALTEEEVAQVKAAFGMLTDDGSGNPLACFLTSTYGSALDMDRAAFLAYFPTGTEGTQGEFEQLKAKYPDFFEGWTWETMPIPIHRYGLADVNAILEQYADVSWEDLPESHEVHSLEKTGCLYNYTSDFGLMGFPCTGGWVYDGGAVVYSGWSALFFAEKDGDYYIQAHLPILVTENGG